MGGSRRGLAASGRSGRSFRRRAEKPRLTSSASVPRFRFRANSAAACEPFGNISSAFAAGVRRVILGTRACESMDFVREACSEFGARPNCCGNRCQRRLCCREGLDRNNDQVRGRPRPVPPRMRARAPSSIPISQPTARSKDQIMPPFRISSRSSTATSSRAAALPRRKTSKRLASMAGLYGAIIGKALYEGKIKAPLPSYK